MGKKKVVIAWISLVVLTGMVLVLTYLRFFGSSMNSHIEEYASNEGQENDISSMLTSISEEYNQSDFVKDYSKVGIDVKVTANQNSLYIQYSFGEKTITYRFTYREEYLVIQVLNDAGNLEVFKPLLSNLILICQKRLQNDSVSILEIDAIVEEQTDWDGIYIENKGETIKYRIDVSKKIETKENNSID